MRDLSWDGDKSRPCGLDRCDCNQSVGSDRERQCLGREVSPAGQSGTVEGGSFVSSRRAPNAISGGNRFPSSSSRRASSSRLSGILLLRCVRFCHTKLVSASA